MRRLARLLVPETPRTIPSGRALGIAFRTGHLLSVGVVLGGSVFGIEGSRLVPFFAAAGLTGLALIALELASTFAWLSTVKGLAVLGKLGLLAILPLLPGHTVPVLVLAVIAASVASHMPSRFRHRRLLGAGRPHHERTPPRTAVAT